MLVNNLLYNLNKNNLLNINHLENNKNYTKNIYESIDSSSSIHKFIYLLIIIFSLYIFSKVTVKINYICGIIVAFILILLYIQYNNNNFEIDDKELRYKLKFLNEHLFNNKDYKKFKMGESLSSDNKSYFSNFSLFIDFLYDIKNYSTYTLKIYQEIIKSTNMFLKLYVDIDNNIDINRNKELAHKYFILSMNNYQSLIYSIPSNQLQYKTLDNKMKIFYNIFQIYLKDIKQKAKKEFYDTPLTNTSIIPTTEIVYPSNIKPLNSFDVF